MEPISVRKLISDQLWEKLEPAETGAKHSQPERLQSTRSRSSWKRYSRFLISLFRGPGFSHTSFLPSARAARNPPMTSMLPCYRCCSIHGARRDAYICSYIFMSFDGAYSDRLLVDERRMEVLKGTRIANAVMWEPLAIRWSTRDRNIMGYVYYPPPKNRPSILASNSLCRRP
jgi:hypothetical protein